MQPSVAAAYSGWENYHRLLTGAIAPLDEHQLSLRAAPHLWSVRRIACHVVAARAYWWHTWMHEGGPEIAVLAEFDEREELHRRSADEIVRALDETWTLVDGCLRRWTDADLDVRFDDPQPHPADPEPWRDRRFIVWHVLEHDLHHGGEISFALGMHRVPAIDL